MSHRKFSDRGGRAWEVRVRSKREWGFEPVGGNPEPRRSGSPPLYAGDDPFELSEQELQRILDDARPEAGGPGSSPSGDGGGTKTSPFGDDYEAPKKASPFKDDLPPKKRSPFLDDR